MRWRGGKRRDWAGPAWGKKEKEKKTGRVEELGCTVKKQKKKGLGCKGEKEKKKKKRE
jgi:hypothetical protein